VPRSDVPASPIPAESATSNQPAQPDLSRIQEVASELGLTTRSIRYYEELGLLSPAARSEGAYRLYDASDVERLRFIKELRDDAGFSLSEIGQLLEDEAARVRSREAFAQTIDPAERRALLTDSLARADRQIGILQAKVDRLEAMVGAVEERRGRLRARLADLDAGGIGEVR
jgi:MerR family transcriptional regulator, repressor of the yfmOP operon